LAAHSLFLKQFHSLRANADRAPQLKRSVMPLSRDFGGENIEEAMEETLPAMKYW
jgi:hypothetical protein